MKYLAIDTSGEHLTVIAENDGKTKIIYEDDCAVKHSVRLMPAVEDALIETGLNLKDADFIACVTGAGSFTGIRIGVSTVKALCYSNGVPFLSITSFDTLAYNKERGKILALIDAKHGNYYACGYTDKVVTIDPVFLNTSEVNELLKSYQAVGYFAEVPFEKVDRVKGFINAITEKANETQTDLNLLEPLYCKKSQAEEENDKKI